jgi:hypothetical protein
MARFTLQLEAIAVLDDVSEGGTPGIFPDH